MAEIIIRVDDFPGTKPGEFDKHNLDSFKRFDEVMYRNGFDSYYLGIIPRYLKKEDIAFFSDNRRIVCALHGINHPEHIQDEFGEYEPRDIEPALKAVKWVLDASLGYSIVDYIPPHNVVNQSTIHALHDLGFRRIWTGPETDLTLDFSGIERLHSFKPFEYGRSDELLQLGSVEYFSNLNKEIVSYLTLHFPWEINIGLTHLDEYLRQLREAM